MARGANDAKLGAITSQSSGVTCYQQYRWVPHHASGISMDRLESTPDMVRLPSLVQEMLDDSTADAARDVNAGQ